MTDQKAFKNFCVLTVAIAAVELRTSKSGRPYTVASASLPMPDGPGLPLRIVALGETAELIFPGDQTLIGRLGVDTRDGVEVPVLFPTRCEAPTEDSLLRNYAVLTLRAGHDADSYYSAKGNYWARVRMALGQGKDESGSYRPSLWMTVKAFTRRDDETVPRRLAALQRGELATLSGRLIYEVSPTNGREYLNLIASDVKAVVPVESPADEECPY
jgi:hypothetical protein